MPQPYLFVSIAIDEAHADATSAQVDMDTVVANHGGEWIHEYAAVIPAGADATLAQILLEISNINQAYDPTFTAVAVYVPARQTWYSTDALTNDAAITAIAGRKPVVL